MIGASGWGRKSCSNHIASVSRTHIDGPEGPISLSVVLSIVLSIKVRRVHGVERGFDKFDLCGGGGKSM